MICECAWTNQVNRIPGVGRRNCHRRKRPIAAATTKKRTGRLVYVRIFFDCVSGQRSHGQEKGNKGDGTEYSTRPSNREIQQEVASCPDDPREVKHTCPHV